MRIVFVIPFPPSLVHSRSYVFVTQLAKRHEVTVVCLCRTPRDLHDVAKLRALGVLVTPVFEEGSVGKLGKAKAMLGDRPVEVALAKASRLRDALWAEIERGDVGVVHVEHLHAAMIARDLPVPTIWDAVSCSARRVRLNNGGKANRLRRAISSVELRRMQAYERRLLKLFRHVVVSTEAELTTVLDLRKTSETFTPAINDDSPTTHVLPAAIDVEYFSPSLARYHHNRLIFSGLLSEGQNRAAIGVLLNTIMPRIWKVRPDVTLTIAGAEPPSSLEALDDARISVTGYVDDLRPYLAGSAIAVSPLPYAVGAPTAILEAMAMGVPVVASDAAAASLRAIPGADILVGGSPERFAHLVLRLLEDDALRHSLARNGRASVERYHAAPLICRQLEALYSVVSGHAFTASDVMPTVAPSPTRMLTAVAVR